MALMTMDRNRNLAALQMGPRVVASTGDVYKTGVVESHKRERDALKGTIGNGQIHEAVEPDEDTKDKSNVVRHVEWTPDGTSLVAINEDNRIRTFIVPPDLLTSSESHKLLPYSITSLPSTPYATSIYPFFNLTSPQTSLFLCSTASHPIQLRSLLYPHIHASYPLIHTETETYLTPHSLLWTDTGTHFLAGTDSQVHLFDASRSNEGPVDTYTTGKKRKRSSSDVPGQTNVRGIISSLCLSSTRGYLAAGSFSRQVLIYSSPFQDGELLDKIDLGREKSGSRSKGNGVTQVAFTSSGNHLIVAERKSDIISVYDLRNTSIPYATLLGRKGNTNQRLGFSVGTFGDKEDVITAGGTDGTMRVWEPFSTPSESDEGKCHAVMELKVADDAVTSSALHATGCVVATSSGERKPELANTYDWDTSDSDENDQGNGDKKTRDFCDNAISIWAI